MAASRTVLALSLLAALAFAGCRFAPDLSAWTSCRDGQACPTGQICLEAEGICVPECGETGLGCAGADAGGDAGVDAGSDAGLDGGTDGGTDGGLDAGPLGFVTDALAAARVDEVYVQVLRAEGGSGAYRFSVVGGGLPAGLALLQEGTLGGTPTVAGTSSFVVQVTDESVPQQVAATGLTLTVAPASGEALTIATDALPAGTPGVAYAAQLTAGGGTPPYLWSLNGALPAGLSFFDDGRIEGTPAAAGESSFEISVRDADPEAPQTAGRGYRLRVEPAAGETLEITTAALPGATAGDYYYAQLAATGGTPPYAWSLTAGSSLPAGLTLSGNVLSGTPSVAGAVTLGIQATDASEPPQLSTATFSISVVSGSVEPLSITTSSLPDGRLGVAYGAQLETAGGTAPVAIALGDGSELPAGLTLSSGGLISGEPTAAGSYSFGVVAADQTAPTAQSATRSFTMAVSNGSGASSLKVTTSALPDAFVGQGYEVTLTATGGTPPYLWSHSGTLPPGLELTGAGALQGTPGEAGEWRFSARVADSAEPPQSAAQSLTLVVQPTSLRIDTTALPDGRIGVAYRAQINASGGLRPYQFALLSGSLPQGLALCEASPGCANPGEISGTPTRKGRNQFVVEVTDASTPTQSSQASFSIDVN